METWEKIREIKEALDPAVYNLAALHILNPPLEAYAAEIAKNSK